jgi:DNA polymerase III delta subunit
VADDLKPAYLIAGGDRPKVDRAVARLRTRFDADAVEHLDASEAPAEDAVAACNAMGLFGAGGRLVVVDNVEAW